MTIAIYREATSISKSTKSHLLVRQDYSNRTELGKNFGKDNILITFNYGNVQEKILFNRTETSNKEHTRPVNDLEFKGFKRLSNDSLIVAYEDLENKHFKQIKKHYETTKTEHKKQAYEIWKKAGSPAEQKPQKMQTIYKGKPDQIHKEFLIAFGGADVVAEDPKTLASIDNLEFYNKCIKAVKNQLKEMGLSDKNLVSIIWHRDEKTSHLHCRYTNFDYENCQSLNTTIEKKCKHNKQAIMQFRKNLLSGLQKTINKSFGFDFTPQKSDPNRKHKTKREWLQEQNQLLEVSNRKGLAQAKYIDDVISNKKKELSSEYFIFDFETLAQNYTFKEVKAKIEDLGKFVLKRREPDEGNEDKNLLNAFVMFIKMMLGKTSKEYFEDKNTYLAIKHNPKNFIQPILVKTRDKQITI